MEYFFRTRASNLYISVDIQSDKIQITEHSTHIYLTIAQFSSSGRLNDSSDGRADSPTWAERLDEGFHTFSLSETLKTGAGILGKAAIFHLLHIFFSLPSLHSQRK